MRKPTTIRNNIRTLRFQADEMTQQELAEEVGVTRQTVHAIEAGKYSPSLEVAFRIAYDTNFFWYPISKLEHQIVAIRHIAHHTGQLMDRLRKEADIGIEWLGRNR